MIFSLFHSFLFLIASIDFLFASIHHLPSVWYATASPAKCQIEKGCTSFIRYCFCPGNLFLRRSICLGGSPGILSNNQSSTGQGSLLECLSKSSGLHRSFTRGQVCRVVASRLSWVCLNRGIPPFHRVPSNYQLPYLLGRPVYLGEGNS